MTLEGVRRQALIAVVGVAGAALALVPGSSARRATDVALPGWRAAFQHVDTRLGDVTGFDVATSERLRAAALHRRPRGSKSWDHSPRWSPDGSRIAYTSVAVDYETGGRLARVNVVSADGRRDRILGPHPQAVVEALPIWSNDGSRVFISRCMSTVPNVTDGDCEAGYAVVPADGPGNGIDIEWVEPTVPEDVIHYHWAPDDQSILTSALDAAGRPATGSHLWDPMTGRSRPAPWILGAASWQRLVP